MSLPAIRIIDVQNGNKVIDMSELTETALGSLIWECEALLSDIKDAHRETADDIGT